MRLQDNKFHVWPKPPYRGKPRIAGIRESFAPMRYRPYTCKRMSQMLQGMWSHLGRRNSDMQVNRKAQEEHFRSTS